MNERSEVKGITLVSLVITIIILLILAGITIIALTGDNGLFSRAKEAREKTKIEEAQEELNMLIMQVQTDKEGMATLTDIVEELKNNGQYTYIIKYNQTAMLSDNGDITSTSDIKEALTNKEEIYVTHKGYEFKITKGLQVAYVGTNKGGEIIDNYVEESEIAELWEYNTTQIPGKVTFTKYIGSNPEVFVPSYVKIDEQIYPVILAETKFSVRNNYGVGPFVKNENIIKIEFDKKVTFEDNSMYSFFRGCTNLKEVDNIPNGVEGLEYTFYDCTNLINVSAIPRTISSMKGTFYNCSSLIEAPVIPESVTDMSYTFYKCTSLKKVTDIPISVTDISNTFYECSSLEGKITIYGSGNIVNCFYNSCINENGLILDYGKNCTNQFADALVKTKNNDSSKISLGECLTDYMQIEDFEGYIEDKKFVITKYLGTSESILIKNEYQHEGTIYSTKVSAATNIALDLGVFVNCKNILKNIEFEDNVEIQRDSCNTFYTFSNLESVILPDTMKSIGKNFFGLCVKLVEVNIPNKLEKIEENSFNNCSSLQNIELPETLTKIKDKAFDSCKGLISLTIPENVILIGMGAFSQCSSVQILNYNAIKLKDLSDEEYSMMFSLGNWTTTLNVGENVERLPSWLSGYSSGFYSGGYVYNTCKYAAFNKVNFIGNKLKLMGYECFQYCKLEEIELPEGLEDMGTNTFYQCNSLKKVYIPSSVNKITLGVFNNNSSTKIYCENTEEEIKAKSGWDSNWNSGKTVVYGVSREQYRNM